MGPILGALFGAFVYDAFLYAGDDNTLDQSFVVFLSISLPMNLASSLEVVASSVSFTDARLNASLRVTTLRSFLAVNNAQFT